MISYGYDTLPKYIFFIYRYFPLLYEMRNVLDWTCASTSLFVVVFAVARVMMLVQPCRC